VRRLSGYFDSFSLVRRIAVCISHSQLEAENVCLEGKYFSAISRRWDIIGTTTQIAYQEGGLQTIRAGA
jgi:hypothetical protein